MPSSTWTSLTDIIDIMMSLNPRPRSVLDVGIGNGKYGFLIKEYLQYWGRRYEQEWQAKDGYKIVGIEAFPEYITEIHRLIYDEILVGDAADILPKLANSQFDLLCMIDVLEHFDPNSGSRILSECQRIGKLTIISTPIEFEPQTNAYGNEFERHRSLWTDKMLYNQGAVWVFNSGDSNWIAIFTQVPEWKHNIHTRKRYNSNLRKMIRLILPLRFRSLFRSY
jgi:SAM-dependent methyltransferase